MNCIDSCFMAKSDIKSAYRLVHVFPDDYPKLGFQFRNDLYFNKWLAQVCASSCKIFEEFSSALEWILRHKYNVNSLCMFLMILYFLHLIMKSTFSIFWHGNLGAVNQISHCVLKNSGPFQIDGVLRGGTIFCGYGGPASC